MMLCSIVVRNRLINQYAHLAGIRIPDYLARIASMLSGFLCKFLFFSSTGAGSLSLPAGSSYRHPSYPDPHILLHILLHPSVESDERKQFVSDLSHCIKPPTYL